MTLINMVQFSLSVNKLILPSPTTPIKITIQNSISKSLFYAIIYLYTKVMMTSGYFQTCQKQLKVTTWFSINASEIVGHTKTYYNHYPFCVKCNEFNLTEKNLNKHTNLTLQLKLRLKFVSNSQPIKFQKILNMNP